MLTVEKAAVLVLNGRVTLYLKYRPQKVGELDLVGVRETLVKILRSKNLPHAWLLTGSRGTGKTSTARIVAKYVNCEAHEKPCNKCEMCLAITHGAAVDVVEIDGASNRGIDEIRTLKERIGLAPMRAKYKVYIIDEAHMLTVEAANALLKTLEEPPVNTLFFLCTTEENKLLPTVVSRCTRIEFNRPSIKEISDKLNRVAKGENFELSGEEAEGLAKMARGSFRDGIKLLEQAIMAGSAEEVLKNAGSNEAEALLELVAGGNRTEALKMVERLAENSVSIRFLIENLTEILHGKILQSPSPDLIKMVWDLQMAYERTKTAAVEQLPLEIWIIEATPSSSKPKDKIKDEVAKEEVKPAVKSSGKHKAFTLEDLNSRWTDILRKVKPMNHSVEALLRSTRALDFDGERLTLEVFYQFHYDKLNTDKCRQIVENSVGEVFENPPVKLFMKLGQKSGREKEEISAKDVDEDVILAAEAIFKASAV